jgi:apolipoprotein N-acyltransferase
VIDPRGPRVTAGITAVVLAVAVLTGNRWVLAAQVVVFAVGALLGVTASPYGLVFRRLVRPRLGPPQELEDPRPPRFAQTVGLVVTAVGLVLALVGVPWAVEVSAGLALVAAVLNAVFGLCLGCELYLLLRRPGQVSNL